MTTPCGLRPPPRGGNTSGPAEPDPRCSLGSDGGVSSPCVNVCRMNAATGLCEGCLRSIGEIASWSQMDAQDKRAVWQRIALRRAEQEA